MIKLTNHNDGNQIHVRADAIHVIAPHPGHTGIRVAGNWIEVKESADAILALMGEPVT